MPIGRSPPEAGEQSPAFSVQLLCRLYFFFPAARCTLPRPLVTDFVFFYGTLMAGFDRRRRAGIDSKLTYRGRGSIQRRAVRSRHLSRRRAGSRRARLGRGLRNGRCRTVLAALDDIEGYRADDPDNSLYSRDRADVTMPDGAQEQAWVYFYNAPLGRAPAHRLGGLSRARESEMNRWPSAVEQSASIASSLRIANRVDPHMKNWFAWGCVPAALVAVAPTLPRARTCRDSIHGFRSWSRPSRRSGCSSSSQKLVSFETRNTFSDPTSATRGIGAARQWILDELKRTSPRLQVSFDTHTIPAGGRVPREVELRNIIAVLPGKSPRRIYVSGHYDSLNLGAHRTEGHRVRGVRRVRGCAGAAVRRGAGVRRVPRVRRRVRRPRSLAQGRGQTAAAASRLQRSRRQGRMTMGAGRCCRWSWRACLPRAASSSRPRSCSWRSRAKSTGCSAPARTRSG